MRLCDVTLCFHAEKWQKCLLYHVFGILWYLYKTLGFYHTCGYGVLNRCSVTGHGYGVSHFICGVTHVMPYLHFKAHRLLQVLPRRLAQGNHQLHLKFSWGTVQQRQSLPKGGRSLWWQIGLFPERRPMIDFHQVRVKCLWSLFIGNPRPFVQLLNDIHRCFKACEFPLSEGLHGSLNSCEDSIFLFLRGEVDICRSNLGGSSVIGVDILKRSGGGSGWLSSIVHIFEGLI